MVVRPLYIALGLTFASASAATFAAAADYEPVAVTVEVSDLDPAKATDREKFDTRLKSAARSACRTGLDNRWAKAEEQRCIEEVLTNGANWAN